MRVVLELASGEPVAGSLLVGDELPRSFTGWMELVAALQSTLDGSATPDRSEADAFSGEQ